MGQVQEGLQSKDDYFIKYYHFAFKVGQSLNKKEEESTKGEYSGKPGRSDKDSGTVGEGLLLLR